MEARWVALRWYQDDRQRRWIAARRELACGHNSIEVSLGRCWDCHLAHLRASGQGDRADRLIVLKRQKDEGTVDFSGLVDGLVAAYEARRKDTEKRAKPPGPGKATGAERCLPPKSRT